MNESKRSAVTNGAPAASGSADLSDPQSDAPQPERLGHLVVGIGASAGGLAAFQNFFSAMPIDSGMAFVLVQHLDPAYNSALVQILSDFTAMPVVKAVDGTVAMPNTVAVIQPNAILKIDHGVLRVAKPETPTARRSSIDIFLTSLAEDQGENAVGIILSGFGSDGTLGIGAIKECGGLTLSQAEFDHRAKLGMPQSAVAGGFVDRVLQVGDMPAALLEHQRYKASIEDPGGSPGADTDIANHLTTICAVLHSRLGRDFAEYKTNTLVRRVRRRMQILRIVDIPRYLEELRTCPTEPELLFKELLIGVTRFFRDPSMFEALAETAIARLVEQTGMRDEPIRVWVAGCATGEEAYSIAMLFKEALLRAESTRRVTIFATDIDERAIAFARAGLYGDAIEADISAARLAQHFLKESSGYRVAKHIREMCVFSAHDLVKNPPFSKLDLISCRNLLIYFAARLQRRVIATFHYGLKPQGTLWLGPSEAIVSSSRIFKAIDKRRRIFRRVDTAPEVPRAALRPGTPKPFAPPARPDSEVLDNEISRVMASFEPAHMVVDARLDIHRFAGAIAKFLEPMSGSANLSLSRLLHPSLRTPGAALVRKAIEEQRRVEDTLNIDLAGKLVLLKLIAEPIATSAAGEQVLLVFQENAVPAAAPTEATPQQAGADGSATQRELRAAREKLQNVTEELESANEELQSSNEEFQSVNEELHSTVEELETSKEELQSINEELQTVNAELSSRADSLVRINSDLSNLFDSTSIATLFLDNYLRIRRFTPAIAGIFNVRECDEGRPITDFASKLADGTLVRDVQSVLRTLAAVEREVETEDGRSTYLLRVKPYRTVANEIDGVVITLVDISERKRLEQDRAYLAAIVHSSEDAIISHDLEGRITSWNRGAQLIYGYAESEVIGQSVSLLLTDRHRDEWPANLARLRRGESIANLDVSRIGKDHRRVDVSLKISPIFSDHGIIVGASAVARDISDRKAAEERAALLMAELDHRVRNILAVVSSVVSQTLSAAGPPQEVKMEIEGRIMAIARTQGLLMQHGGVEGALADLICTELSPYAQRANVTMSGDDVVLTSKASLILAMAIHELATNAVKYGALSVATGQLDVSWRVVSVDGEPILTLDWKETGGPAVKEPKRRGFGTKLIELSLVRGLGADVTRDFAQAGIHCSFRFPLAADIGRLRMAPEEDPPEDSPDESV